LDDIVRKYYNQISNLLFVDKLEFELGYYYKGFLNNNGLPEGPGVYYLSVQETFEAEHDHNGIWHGKVIWINSGTKCLVFFDHVNHTSYTFL